MINPGTGCLISHVDTQKLKLKQGLTQIEGNLLRFSVNLLFDWEIFLKIKFFWEFLMYID